MKKITFCLLLSLVIVFSAEAHKYRNGNAQISISIQTFYDQLSPYGDWIYSPDFGYVWRPYFDSPEDFRPYSSAGNWVYTTYGWTWVSDYNWGWATFHYGRWDFDDYLGWMWIPGYEWAPAWVSWGSYNNYWGWAPMGPNIYARSNSNWYAPDPWWTFVPQNQFCSNNWNNFIYDRPVHITNITHITNVYVNNNNNNSWYNGPRVSDVERYSRSRVRTMEVYDNQRPENTGVRNDRLNVYRPTVDNRRTGSRPTEYRNVDQARPATRIQQTNARTNNPGVNRTRENRTETRISNPIPSVRNGNLNNGNRVGTGSSTTVTNPRSGGTTREQEVTPRTAQQPATRTNNVPRGTNAEPRTGVSVAPDRNSTRTTVEPQRQASDREANTRVTDRNPSSSPASVTAPRNNAPANGNVNRNLPTDQGNRSTVQPSREQRPQNTAPGTVSGRESTERRQTPGTVTNPVENKTASGRSENKTSVNPARR